MDLCPSWETISSWLDVAFVIDSANPLTTPLIVLQEIHMDDVVLLRTDTSTELGAVFIKEIMQ